MVDRQWGDGTEQQTGGLGGAEGDDRPGKCLDRPQEGAVGRLGAIGTGSDCKDEKDKTETEGPEGTDGWPVGPCDGRPSDLENNKAAG